MQKVSICGVTMTKRKRLVCVGWGIFWLYRSKEKPSFDVRVGRQRTLSLAVAKYDNLYERGTYSRDRRKGLIIAKKLWVEVKDE